jgi:hypothetical protein
MSRATSTSCAMPARRGRRCRMPARRLSPTSTRCLR